MKKLPILNKNLKNSFKSQLAFTLIELLVVIAILGILAAVVWTAINPLLMVKKSRDAGRKSDLANLTRGLDIYTVSGYGFQNGGFLPGYDGSNPIDRNSTMTDICGTTIYDAENGGWLVTDNVTLCDQDEEADLSSFLSVIPIDPLNDSNYRYRYVSDDGTHFCLEALLEEDNFAWRVGTNVRYCD